MDADKPCRCPRCGWLGTIHDAEAYQPLAHLEPLNICPRCATETEVQPLGQKGLDALYREYALLLKPGYQHQGDRAERRAQLERFFEHIDHPPRSTSGPNLAMAFKVIDESDKKRDRTSEVLRSASLLGSDAPPKPSTGAALRPVLFSDDLVTEDE